ncbi:MAG: hypothetical protein AAFN74_18715 [Myxococcota bacterium]
MVGRGPVRLERHRWGGVADSMSSVSLVRWAQDERRRLDVFDGVVRQVGSG